jgi:hypothetical protein
MNLEKKYLNQIGDDMIVDGTGWLYEDTCE